MWVVLLLSWVGVAAAGGGTVTYFAGSSGYNDLYPLEYQVWAARTWQRGPCVRYARFRPTDFYAVSDLQHQLIIPQIADGNRLRQFDSTTRALAPDCH